MTSDKYKKLCNHPNAFSRWDLEITEKKLRERNLSVALRLAEILQTSPIPKPEKHKDDKSTDYFLITLPESETEIIIDVFMDLEADHVENDGKTTSLASFYAGVTDKWMKYVSAKKS